MVAGAFAAEEPRRPVQRRRPGLAPGGQLACAHTVTVVPALRRTGPSSALQWYGRAMSGTYRVVMGDRGRLVVPAELRERLDLRPGVSLVLVETPHGLVLATREQLKRLVRDQLHGLDLVEELLADRRREAAADEVA